MAAEAKILSSVLEGLLDKLSSSIQKELGLLLGVEEKRALESNLSTIRAVLQDAENRQVNERVVKDWLRKLKDAAYDAEDLVDEFVVEARRRVVGNQDGMGKKISNFFSPSNPLAFRFKMAHRMKELVERFDGIAKEGHHVQSQPFISSTRETTSSVNESSVYGRDNEKEKLIDSLTNSGNESVLSVIPIVGMGGLGKTTLAQLVYNDEKSVATHFDLKLWVYVSEKFNLRKLLKGILESAKKDIAENLSMERLQTLLRETLGGKRYLLVLDDVWYDVRDGFFEKWDRLKTLLECGSMGSKVLVTTPDGSVADIVGTLPTHQLGKLSMEDSRLLFEELVNPGKNLPQNLLSIGKEMVGKCGGLPLAVKALGGLMSFEKTDVPYWEYVKTREFWQLPDNNERVLSILRLSYDHLTSSLKQCFAYCAVIPKGGVIVKDKLIKQWIAQGFIHSDRENDELQEEEKGEEFFKELLRRSLFQFDVGPYGIKEESCKMHDLIHDLLKSVAREEFIIVKAPIDTIPSKTRHLALMEEYEWVREPKNLDALKKCKKLRTMITAGPIDINVCLSFRWLRVLDLSWNEGICFLPNSIDKLRHLRYFDISRTKITELPETICNLHNLQTLRVFGIRLKKWPKNMKRMISLRHIEFDEGDDFPLPKGIGELTFLRTLPKFIFAKESGAGIEELKYLNLWRDVDIRGLDNITNVRCAREADLKAKKHVNSLKLSWSGNEAVATEGNAKEVIEVLEPHSDLKELWVENYTGLGFPSWMTEKLTNLNEILLVSCKRCERLPPLGQLPFLESLGIGKMDAIKHIVEFDRSHNYEDLFPSLKDLGLLKMPNLEGWSSPQEDGDGDEQGRERDKQVIFKCLRFLEIHDCPKLVRPLWLPLLPRLESLKIGGMGWDMIEISTSQPLMEVELNEMPNLERWSPHEADDGTPVIFRSLRTLRISECPKLICLHQFLLPALKELEMKGVGCEKIEFSRSKSLKKVKLTKMPNLERWSPQEADDDEQVVFHRLVELVVKECPKMVRLPHLLPSLKKLEISDSNEMLLASVANYTSLSKLSIHALPEVKHLPEEFGRNHTSLRELRISNCPKLISLSNQLKNLLALKELTVEGCNDLVLSSPDGLQQQQRSPPLNSLEVLKIKNSCEKQTSLPGDGIVLPSLRTLEIFSCKNIESLSVDMLQKLTNLTIINSPKVLSSLVSLENLKSLESLGITGCPQSVMMKLLESMENLTSLVDLTIGDCSDMRSLPKSVKTFTSLTFLHIVQCPVMRSLPEWVGDLTLLRDLTICDSPGMKSLPKGLQRLKNLEELSLHGCLVLRSLPEWVGDLTSLTSLSIYNCPGMMSLPEGLQRLKNLEHLWIGGCPVLEGRLQRNKGQDWHKVAHVPDIDIDTGIASEDSEGEESSDQSPHLLLHSLKKLDKLLPLPSCCSSSPSPSSPPPT